MKKDKFETVSIPGRVKQQLREIADHEHRSLAGQITYWIEQHLQQQQKETA